MKKGDEDYPPISIHPVRSGTFTMISSQTVEESYRNIPTALAF
jgi:hypothetical protein